MTDLPDIHPHLQAMSEVFFTMGTTRALLTNHKDLPEDDKKMLKEAYSALFDLYVTLGRRALPDSIWNTIANTDSFRAHHALAASHC